MGIQWTILDWHHPDTRRTLNSFHSYSQELAGMPEAEHLGQGGYGVLAYHARSGGKAYPRVKMLASAPTGIYRARCTVLLVR
jgi:hypothetical protein